MTPAQNQHISYRASSVLSVHWIPTHEFALKTGRYENPGTASKYPADLWLLGCLLKRSDRGLPPKSTLQTDSGTLGSNYMAS